MRTNTDLACIGVVLLGLVCLVGVVLLGKFMTVYRIRRIKSQLPDIEEMKKAGDVGGLIAVLNSDHYTSVDEELTSLDSSYMSRYRYSAAKALSELGEEAIVLLLASFGVGNHPSANSIRALNEIGWEASDTARETLYQLLANQDREVRSFASERLGKIGWRRDDREAAAFCQLLANEDSSVRQFAIKELDRIGWQLNTAKQQATYWAAKQRWDKCIESGYESKEPLVHALSSFSMPMSDYLSCWQALEQTCTEAVSDSFIPDCFLKEIKNYLENNTRTETSMISEYVGEDDDYSGEDPIYGGWKRKDKSELVEYTQVIVLHDDAELMEILSKIPSRWRTAVRTSLSPGVADSQSHLFPD
jgi:hypothetical protein